MRLLILTTPRTGSTWVTNILYALPHVIAGGELYNGYTDYKEPNWTVAKLFSYHLHEHKFTDEYRVKLIRRDINAQLASWEKASTTGYWTPTKKTFSCVFDRKWSLEQIAISRQMPADRTIIYEEINESVLNELKQITYS